MVIRDEDIDEAQDEGDVDLDAIEEEQAVAPRKGRVPKAQPPKQASSAPKAEGPAGQGKRYVPYSQAAVIGIFDNDTRKLAYDFSDLQTGLAHFAADLIERIEKIETQLGRM